MIKACIAFTIIFFTIIILKNLVDRRDTLTVNSTIIRDNNSSSNRHIATSSAQKKKIAVQDRAADSSSISASSRSADKHAPSRSIIHETEGNFEKGENETQNTFSQKQKAKTYEQSLETEN